VFFQAYSLRCLFITILLAFVINAHGQAGNGTVTGTVYDPSGDAVMPGVKVLAICGETVESSKSNNAGVYSFSLAPGSCQISTSGNFLYPLKRAPIVVSRTKTVTVNLYPSLWIKTQALVATRKGVVDEYSYWPSSKFRLIVSKDGNRYLVEFKNKKILHKVQTYRSTGFERVKITRDTLTVLGREMAIDRRGQIKVVGNVLIDYDGDRTRAES